MASIKIHQDIFNFERRRKGFTMRQLAGIAGSVAVIGGGTALLSYGLALPWTISIAIATCIGVIPCVLGFLPFYNMPAEEFIKRAYDQQKRGRRFCLNQDFIEVERGELSRAEKKQAKKRGFECLY